MTNGEAEAKMEEKKEKYEIKFLSAYEAYLCEYGKPIGAFGGYIAESKEVCRILNAHDKMVEVLRKADSVIHELYAENPENITYEIDEKSDAGIILRDIEAILAEEPK